MKTINKYKNEYQLGQGLKSMFLISSITFIFVFHSWLLPQSHVAAGVFFKAFLHSNWGPFFPRLLPMVSSLLDFPRVGTRNPLVLNTSRSVLLFQMTFVHFPEGNYGLVISFFCMAGKRKCLRKKIKVSFRLNKYALLTLLVLSPFFDPSKSWEKKALVSFSGS